MSLRTIVQTLGGDLYDHGRRANIPAPNAGVAANVALPPPPHGDWNEWSASVRAGRAQEERGREGTGAPKGRMALARAQEPDPDDRDRHHHP
jgi:hypothetical protein